MELMIFFDLCNGTLNFIMSSKNMENTQLLKIQGLEIYTQKYIYHLYFEK